MGASGALGVALTNNGALGIRHNAANRRIGGREQASQFSLSNGFFNHGLAGELKSVGKNQIKDGVNISLPSGG